MRYMNRISRIIYSKIKRTECFVFLQSSLLKTSKNTTSVQKKKENNEIHVTMTDLLVCEMSQ